MKRRVMRCKKRNAAPKNTKQTDYGETSDDLLIYFSLKDPSLPKYLLRKERDTKERTEIRELKYLGLL